MAKGGKRKYTSENAQKVYKKARTASYRAPKTSRYTGRYGRFSGPGGELKFFDTQVNFPVDNTPEVPSTGQLVLIPQGVTESTRVGARCCIKSIQFNGIATLIPSTSAISAVAASVMLVQDTQCNGAAATATQVYDAPNSLVQSVRNLENSARFKVLKRWDMTFNPSAGVSAAYNDSVRRFDYYTRCNIPLEFSSTTGAITELKSNNLFLIAGSQGNGSDDTVTIAATCRVRYED